MCDISIKQCKYVYQRAGRKDKRCTRVCRTLYCGDYCSSHYWQLNRVTKDVKSNHVIHDDDTFENTETSEKKVPLFKVKVFIFPANEWAEWTDQTYDNLRVLFPELNKIELSKLAAQNADYMKKFPHIKIQRIN
jgi:hypothetical protein